ncbi:MAG: PAS domain S-box protein, partial [Thermoplasmata archaeon]|nr:PAS domain S-box protein [Thermoplasmata archaeon]
SGDIVFANAPFVDLFGAASGSIFEAVQGEARESVFHLMEAVSKGGHDSRDIVIGESALRVDAIATSAAAEYVHLVVSDVSRDRELDALRTLVENLPHPAVALDGNGIVTRSSEAARSAFGRLDGRPMAEALPALADFLASGEASVEVSIETGRFRVDRHMAVGHTIVTMVDVTRYVARDDAIDSELDALRRSLASLSSLGTALVRTSGDRVVDWPEEAARLTGVEGKGRNLFDAIGMDRNRAQAILSEGAMRAVVDVEVEGERLPLQVLAVRKEGDIHAMLLDYTPERGLQEKLNEYARSLEARISELERDRGGAAAATEDRLASLRAAIDEASDAVQDILYVRDSGGRIVHLSPSGKAALGVGETPVQIVKLLADPDLDASRALLGGSRVSDDVPAFIDMIGPRGTVALEILERRVEGSALEQHLGKVGKKTSGPLFLGVARDITRRLEMEKQLEAYTARLEARAKLTDDALARQMEEMAFFQGLAMDLATAEGPADGGRHLLEWAVKWLSDRPMALYLVNVETGRYELVSKRGVNDQRSARFAVLHPERLRVNELSDGKVPATFAPKERDAAVLGEVETTLVPLFSGGDVVGVLATSERPPEGYTLSSLLFNAGIFFDRMRAAADLKGETGLLGSVLSMQRASLEALGPDEILNTTLERLVGVCNCDAALLVIDDGGPQVFRIFPARAVRLEPGTKVDMSVIDLGEMVNQREVVVKDLVADGTSGDFEVSLLDAGVRSFLVIPILKGGELLGAIYLCRKGETPFSRDEVRSARDLSDIASAAVDRGFSYRQLEMLEKHYETIVEASLDGIAIVRDGEVTYANGAMSRVVRRKRNELVGSELLSIVMPEHRERVEEALGAASEVGEGAEVEFHAETGKGEWVALRATVLGIDHHGRRAVLCIVREMAAPDPRAEAHAREAADRARELEALREEHARAIQAAAAERAADVEALKAGHETEARGLAEEARRAVQVAEDLRTKREEAERLLTAARASLASAKDLMESLDEFCLIVGREREVSWANSAFLLETGFRAADLRGTRWSDIVPVMKRSEADVALESSDEFEFPILVKKGGDVQVRWRAVAAGEGHYLVGTPVREREPAAAPKAAPGVVAFRMSTGGELEDVSGDVIALLGYGREEVLDIPYFLTKVTHPGDAERIKKKLLRLIKFKEFDPEDEYRISRKDGRTLHVRERLEPVYDGTGKLIGVKGELTDVSGDRAERDGLRDRLGFVSSVLDSVPGTGVVAVDRDRTILHMNAAAVAMLGLPEEAAIGRTVESLVVERSEVIELMKAAIRGDRAEAKLSAEGSDGKMRFWASVAPRKKGSDIVGYVMALRPLD